MNKIIFFSGKGGVGKTSCASSFAISKINQNKKVLLVSTDPAHSTSDIFEMKINNTITTILDNLDAIEINPEEESKKYINSIRNNLHKIISPAILSEINTQLDAASVSPGTHEASLFDKMLSIINTEIENYDYIIFDTAPTGHTLRLFTLPELLGSWIDSLVKKRKKVVNYKKMSLTDKNKRKNLEHDPIIEILNRRKENLEKARKIMIDQNKLSFIFVLNAEKLPIDETKKAIEILNKYSIPVGTLIVNRILPKNIKDEFFIRKKEHEIKHLKTIYEYFKDFNIIELPLLERDMDFKNINELSNFFKTDKNLV
ncbi:ArsA family ATPase [Helicovermis profundi]|uniref:TRC40/GET3/ArsA family transport-energizing ATPase n=1 Tax=Helicovermis profundi TaxID=3065157 RepID=A0AAU9E1P0_9FIRM|nr:TRC40/GET3/ArsA family transport-energizing ATPase [Clostridia bacterium S502]